MDWKTVLAYVTGSVDEELLRRDEYLVAENRILRAHIPGRVPVSNGDRRTLAEIGKRLGRQALAEIANIVRPETILYCPAFDETVRDGGVRPVRLPPCSPNLNPHAEPWVRSVKDECLSKLILFGEPALRTALRAYVEHFHGERNHQGKNNLLLFPCEPMGQVGPVRCRERLGGLLKFYYRAA